jgi:plastocyanin
MAVRRRVGQDASGERARRGTGMPTDHGGRSVFSNAIPDQKSMEASTMNLVAKFAVLASCLTFAGATFTFAQSPATPQPAPTSAQIVAVDECDPTTFNAALGADFCKNVSLGEFTTFDDLFAKAAAGTPDPGWDFEPDQVRIKQGATLSVVDQGGEPHTFTEVAHFGGGFVTGLNAPGEKTIPECTTGFSNLEVAKTRILQGSTITIANLPKGKHRFQCCIHPWMRTEVEVK